MIAPDLMERIKRSVANAPPLTDYQTRPLSGLWREKEATRRQKVQRAAGRE